MYSQADSINLNEVEIRSMKTDSVKSYAYSISSQNLENQNGKNLSSINESLHNFAGLFSLSGNNFAQDSRISSRGFGARGAFGIRGIKIFLDEIPLSTPDGQCQLDDINFNEIKNIVLIRGPVSGLYGNSAGGAILLSTAGNEAEPSVRFVSNLGSYGYKNFGLTLNKSYKSIYFHTDYAHIAQDGYRSWSSYKSNVFNLNARMVLKNSSLKFFFNHSKSPIARDPGALTFEEDQTTPRNGRDRNILFDAGEKVSQTRLGIVFNHFHLNEKKITIKLYGSTRNFEAKLPVKANGGIDLQRNLVGGNADYFKTINFSDGHLFFNLGLESEYQIDTRIQKDNNEGKISDDTSFNQNEIFVNHAVYSSLKYNYKKINLHGSLRLDYILSKAEDFYLTNGDQSASQKSFIYNPGLGLNMALTKFLNANFLFSQGFENPTLIELSNNPKLIGGFNEELKPMKSQNFESSFEFKNQNSFVNFSVFQINTKNEIVGYEISGQSGRSFYKNFGKTKRKGFEFECMKRIKTWISFQASYTYSNFIYSENNLDGNKLPGIPSHQASLETTFNFIKKFTLHLDKRYVSKIALDDVNNFFTRPYFDIGLRCAYSFKLYKINFTTSLSIKNISSSEYYSNLRINATGGRYYERAPDSNALLGIKIEI